jgi:hypothetical protein
VEGEVGIPWSRRKRIDGFSVLKHPSWKQTVFGSLCRLPTSQQQQGVVMCRPGTRSNILSAYRKLLKLSRLLSPEKRRVETYQQIQTKFRQNSALQDKEM